MDFKIISQECSLGDPLPILFKAEQHGHQFCKEKKTQTVNVFFS